MIDAKFDDLVALYVEAAIREGDLSQLEQQLLTKCPYQMEELLAVFRTVDLLRVATDSDSNVLSIEALDRIEKTLLY